MPTVTQWRVLVPIKQGQNGKSRLAHLLPHGARADLVERMAQHVLDVLSDCFETSNITILSPQSPENWTGQWARDEGRGLNCELAAWRALQGDTPVLILHADLPLLTSNDVQALIKAADYGAALATDRAGQGTNALAIADGRAMDFCFGPDSRLRHIAQYPDMPVVQIDGLSADLDTADDVRFIQSRGFTL